MCSVSFFQKSDFKGKGKAFNDAQVQPDLTYQYYDSNQSEFLFDNIDTIQTDSNAWVIVFDNIGYKGNYLLVEPNSNISDLNKVHRDNKGDWKNQIKSFIMYDVKPPFWDAGVARPYIDYGKLASYYPQSYTEKDNNTFAYQIEDSIYRINCPIFSNQTLDKVVYSITLDHENAASKDDHASFLAVFDNKGVLQDITSFVWAKGGAFQISDDAVSDIEDGIDFIADLADPFTDGAATEIAKQIDRAFSISCKLFNFASMKIYKLTDNGGMFYFLPVICHTINRLSWASSIEYPDHIVIIK
ncbi:hypothetical protein VB796_18595 [Arcicella sp. LKC2W]|uniref:hypothetical protein n=1 Tax=Arcicella sp. LKC2W TaxID=2984198 RepID=UPI002B20C8D8|nr:hypothetical protein [Arcicella sp. LKC2W]MEA5461078.1 hypothetical protein [Arcicella sp. LKC2W]